MSELVVVSVTPETGFQILTCVSGEQWLFNVRTLGSQAKTLAYEGGKRISFKEDFGGMSTKFQLARVCVCACVCAHVCTPVCVCFCRAGFLIPSSYGPNHSSGSHCSE